MFDPANKRKSYYLQYLGGGGGTYSNSREKQVEMEVDVDNYRVEVVVVMVALEIIYSSHARSIRAQNHLLS